MQMLAFYFSSLILAQNDIKRKCHSMWIISDLLVVNPLLTEEKADSVDMLLKPWRSDEGRW